MPINDRKEGDFILDFRINVVDHNGREKTAHIEKKKLSFRAKLPSKHTQRIYNSLETSFNRIIDKLNKSESGENYE